MKPPIILLSCKILLHQLCPILLGLQCRELELQVIFHQLLKGDRCKRVDVHACVERVELQKQLSVFVCHAIVDMPVDEIPQSVPDLLSA